MASWTQFIQRFTLALGVLISQKPSLDKQLHKAVYVGVFVEQGPVEPTDFVVLAVGVVVAVLRAADFVSHLKSWERRAKQIDGQEILYLPIAEPLNLRIIGRALDTTVPASIVIAAVAVIFLLASLCFCCKRPGR